MVNLIVYYFHFPSQCHNFTGKDGGDECLEDGMQIRESAEHGLQGEYTGSGSGFGKNGLKPAT
ncbi:hypothetical protein KKC44_04335 [Patescibacteria group bacterium]|nr:hypothetical protein [Patescibacteria group bacterium]MBU2259806.1 hypothetical protein [Patescibacteria group bacterium]